MSATARRRLVRPVFEKGATRKVSQAGMSAEWTAW